MKSRIRNLFVVVSVPALLAACAEPSAVEFNGDSVVMRTSTPQLMEREEAAVEAQRICSKVGKNAEYASTTYVHDLNYRNLFLCL